MKNREREQLELENHLRATVKEYKDVRGRVLKYMVITNSNGQEYFINIGDKTYEVCSQMLREQLNGGGGGVVVEDVNGF